MLSAHHLGCVLPARKGALISPARTWLASSRPQRPSMHPGTGSPMAPLLPSRHAALQAASDDADPSMLGGPEPSLVDKIKLFWMEAPPSLKIPMLLAIPLMWFLSKTALYDFIATGISNLIEKLFGPLTSFIEKNVLNTLQYRMLQVFSLPTTGKLWAVFAVGAPVVYLGGWAYKTVTGVDWGEAVARSYFTLNNVPGMDCTNEESQAGGIVLNCIHILSLFTFAILVGILTDDISSAVEEVHSGNFPVPVKDHTVVVGWNSQTMPILHQIMKNIEKKPDGVFRAPVLVLNPRPKEEMDEELMEEFGDEVVGTQIITREGFPLRRVDLERVNAGQARTVLWLVPDMKYMRMVVGDEFDTEDLEDKDKGGGKGFLPMTPRLVSAMANIQSLGMKESEPQNLVFQSRDLTVTNDPAMQVVLNRFQSLERKYTLVQVADMRSLTEVMAQCAGQPGLADVFETLFERNQDVNPDFKLVDVGHMVGWTFKDVRLSYYGPVAVCGTLKSGLNPPDDYIIEADDKIVVLVMGMKKDPKAASSPKIAPVLPEHVKRNRSIPARNFVVMSHSGDPSLLVEALLESVDQESKVASTITVLTPNPVDGPSGTKKVRVKYMTGDLGSRETLVKAGIETADSVVLHFMSEHSPEDADTQVVADVVMLQGIVKSSSAERNRSLGVIACVNDMDTREVLEKITGSDYFTGVNDSYNSLHVDCIQPDKLLGGILTEVASCPELQPVFQDLFDADGNEIYAKPVQHYAGLKVDSTMGWDLVQEIVRQEGDLLIGYIDAGEQVHLAVDRDAKVTFSQGDRLIVFAEDMY